MFKYTKVFALLAVFAFQEATAYVVENQNVRLLGSFIKKVEDAIVKITNIVINAVENAISKLTQLLSNLINLAKNIIKTAISSILEEIQKIVNQIETIKEDAGAVGVDIKECLAENEQALEEIETKIIAGFVSCVTAQVEKAENIVNGAIQDIIDIKNEVLSLPEKLANCVTGGKSISCLLGLLAEIVEQTVPIPIKITMKVGQVVELVAGIEGKMKVCAATKIVQTSTEAAAIGIRIASCATEKNYLFL